MNEIRKDYILDRYVIISTERARRPDAFNQPDRKNKGERCPFCSGKENSTPEPIEEIPNEDWGFRLFPNKFPALNENSFEGKDEDGIFTKIDSFGFHEVLVETPDHSKDLYEFDVGKIKKYLDILRERYAELKSREDISYVSIFKNRGERAGESIEHPHTQLIASPIVPEEISKLIEKSREFYEESGECPYCKVVRREINKDERIIEETDNFLVICPYASVWPYESLILPKRHISEIKDLNGEEVEEISHILKTLFGKYHDLFGYLPYNLLYYSFPEKEYTHFHIAVKPKLKIPGGFEEFGLYINEVLPEGAAEELNFDL